MTGPHPETAGQCPQGRHKERPDDDGIQHDPDGHDDRQLPELELDARLSQQRLEEALASISPMMRAVVLLRLRDERSYQEIAAELRITDRQVRRYLARGYECLRVAIEG